MEKMLLDLFVGSPRSLRNSHRWWSLNDLSFGFSFLFVTFFPWLYIPWLS
jgi:hypothetical protein